MKPQATANTRYTRHTIQAPCTALARCSGYGSSFTYHSPRYLHPSRCHQRVFRLVPCGSFSLYVHPCLGLAKLHLAICSDRPFLIDVPRNDPKESHEGVSISPVCAGPSGQLLHSNMGKCQPQREGTPAKELKLLTDNPCPAGWPETP